MQIDIIEGARGGGKSTIAFKLRQKNSDTTLINFTGFHEDGKEGLDKVSDYYNAWMILLFKLHFHDSNYVFDRFFFSEMVYSKLYKNYDFKSKYIDLLEGLESLSEMGVKINIFFLTVNDEEELKQRLIRDKVPFGKAEESVIETMKQQESYEQIFTSFAYNRANKNMKIHFIETNGKTNDEVYDEIINLKTTR